MADQADTTNAIAQSVSDASGGAPTPAPTTGAPQSQGPSFFQRIAFGLANVGTHGALLQQKMEEKYRMELMDKELAYKEKQGRDQLQQQLIMQGLQSQGSAFLANPKVQKMIGIENLPLYQQYGQAVDAQKKLVQAALVAAHMDPNLANLPPQAEKMIEAQQKNAITMRGQDIGLQRTEMEQGGANARTAFVQGQENARSAAEIAAANARAALKTSTDIKSTLPTINTATQTLLTRYDPASGQKYTNQAAIAAAKAHNQLVDDAEKRLRKTDPSANLDNFRVKIQGVDKDGNEVTKSHLFGAWKSTVPVTIVPWNSAGVKSGPEAAGASIVKPEGIPSDAVRKMMNGKLGWYSPSKGAFKADG